MTDSTQAWLAAYLFYPDPWERFLLQAVKPFVEKVIEKRLAEQFFFIRYWERGPHIRLRFKGERALLESTLKPELKEFFERYFAENPIPRTDPPWTEELPAEPRWFPNHSVQFIDYEPEIDRYGGPAGILIAEKQFEVSSRVVLAIIAERDPWDYDRALGAAIQLHLGFAWALGMSLTETTQFYSKIFKDWFSRAYAWEPDISAEALQERRRLTLKAFEEKFAAQKSTLVSYFKTLWNAFDRAAEFEQAWLNDWLDKMSVIGEQLRAAQKDRRLLFPQELTPDRAIPILEAQQRLWYILGSYVHMTNNRLGILNRDEAYLGYLIKSGLAQM